MQIKQIKIENFRGIRELHWSIGTEVVCLIGLGDSTKSTILDAIELALCPRFNPPITDTDFFEEDPNRTILIEVTVGQLPLSFLRDDKFGLFLRGWSTSNTLQDEPADQDEPVLTIKIRIDASLEPTWTVVNQRVPEGRTILVRDRELLGAVRLGSDVDRHFFWGRGSALSRITSGDVNPTSVLAEANRRARQQLNQADTTTLKEASRRTQRVVEKFGIRPREEFQPALDTRAAPSGMGALSLYEGVVPLRARGLGSRRLIALALQTLSVKDGAIALIDEIESGLEPHRIRDVLNKVQEASRTEPGTEQLSIGQVFMTTHSPTAIRALTIAQLKVVRSSEGRTEVLSLSSELQATVRSCPEALLARKIIVCEGKTELGLIWGLEDSWSHSRAGISLSYLGVVPIDGNGKDNAAGHARNLRELQYEVAILVDSDAELTPSVAELETLGIKVIRWSGQCSTEYRTALDLPWEHFKRCITLAMDFADEQSVRDAIFAQLPHAGPPCGFDPQQWIGEDLEQGTLRIAFAQAAIKKANAWVKKIEPAQALGCLIGESILQMEETDLARKLKELESWVYA